MFCISLDAFALEARIFSRLVTTPHVRSLVGLFLDSKSAKSRALKYGLDHEEKDPDEPKFTQAAIVGGKGQRDEFLFSRFLVVCGYACPSCL